MFGRGPAAANKFPSPRNGTRLKVRLEAREQNSQEETAMATYVLLATYTEQGLKGIKDTVKRTEAVRELAKKAGLTMKESYWTLGAYDVVAVFDAQDDESMTAFSLSIAKLGNVKTQTLRAFSSKDMASILGKMV
jgi:uncharacterized protein with GYD domain